MTDEEERMTDRRKLSLREIVMLITLLLNFGGLVWGAATIVAAVNTLTSTVNKLDGTVTQVVSDLADMKIEYHSRIKVLEDRQERRR